MKNTVNISYIDNLVQELKSRKIPFSVAKIGEVKGNGLHDETRKYKIRRLVYQNCVILEQMIRTPYYDVDDFLVCREFTKHTEPTQWPLEVENG